VTAVLELRKGDLAMGGVVRVEHKEGDLFEIRVRDHVLHVDQPRDAGGTDKAPTPTELFVVSLASCVAFYARRFLTRHGLSTEGLSVTATSAMAERPARVSEVDVTIEVPEGVPEDQRERLLAVATHCTVHNTLENPPNVKITVGRPSTVGALS
jgi:uncharacterized OsmC-like protein